MSSQQFVVSQVNPNDTHGGGGCACDPRKQEDCKPPYVVIIDNEMLDHLSPRVVVCKACAEAFVKAMGGEALEVGERDPLQSRSELAHNEALGGSQHINPEVDDSELLAALKAEDVTPDI